MQGASSWLGNGGPGHLAPPILPFGRDLAAPPALHSGIVTVRMKTIAILGAGFGGIQAARNLGRFLKRKKLTDAYQIVVVDKNQYHTFSPTLYEIATTSDYIASASQLKRIVTLPLKAIFEGLPIHHIADAVASVDVTNREIHLEKGTLVAYDWLVVALGSQTNFFAIPGLTQHALPLKTFYDALRIRETLLQKIELDERKTLHIVIGGGGPTGVELAGELSTLLTTLPRVACGACQPTVSLVDGAQTVLSAFDKKIIDVATERLKKLGVAIITGERIQSVSETEITLQSGFALPYDILLWTGGVTPHQLTTTLPLKKDQSGVRILASETMRCLPGNEELGVAEGVYGIGDAVCFIDPKTNRPTPGVAPAAIQQGKIVAHNIGQEILAEQDNAHALTLKRFHPKTYPYILPIGGKFAVVKMGPFVISGLTAWFVKGLVELSYFVSILPLYRALTYWLAGLWIFIRNNKVG